VPLHACTPRLLTRVTNCAHAARRQTHEAPLNALHGALVDRKARPRWRTASHRVTPARAAIPHRSLAADRALKVGSWWASPHTFMPCKKAGIAAGLSRGTTSTHA